MSHGAGGGAPGSIGPLDAAGEACRRAGLPAAGLTLLHAAEESWARLPDGTLVRVGAGGDQARARHELAVARWLHDSAVPAATPVDGLGVVEVLDRPVTFWAPLPRHVPGRAPVVAAALKRLHAMTPPPHLGLAAVDPTRHVEPRVRHTTLVPATDRNALLAVLDRLREEWSALPPGLPRAVVHGDAWAGNVVETDDGRVLLLDLVRVGLGPPEWDLVATAVERTTFGVLDEAGYREFADAYGADVIAWSGFPVVRRLRELRVVAYALQAAEQDPRHEAQALARVHDFLADRRPWPGWRPL